MPRLLALHKGNPNVKIFLSADREALHGEVMKLLDRVRSAGIEKVAYEIKIKHGATGDQVCRVHRACRERQARL